MFQLVPNVFVYEQLRFRFQNNMLFNTTVQRQLKFSTCFKKLWRAWWPKPLK